MENEKNLIDCLSWEKQYNTDRFPTRIEDLANCTVRAGQCCPGDWHASKRADAIRLSNDLYAIEYEYNGDSNFVWDHDRYNFFESKWADNDFQLIDWEKGRFILKDVLGKSDELMNGMVIICDDDGTHCITLGEAVKKYGIKKEGDKNDCRRFARCPSLNNLCGPMFPNDGFIARYESWHVYEMLSR